MEKRDYTAPIGLHESLGTFEVQSHFFISNNLYILTFDIKIISFFDLTIVKVINVGIVNYSYKQRKFLMLIIAGEDLSKVFVFVISPQIGGKIFGCIIIFNHDINSIIEFEVFHNFGV